MLNVIVQFEVLVWVRLSTFNCVCFTTEDISLAMAIFSYVNLFSLLFLI